MTNETLQKKLDSILTEHTTKEVAFAEVLNLINILKSDISLAIKSSGQTGGVVDFIAVPTAIDIVTKGGIPTKAERIRLAMESFRFRLSSGKHRSAGISFAYRNMNGMR